MFNESIIFIKKNKEKKNMTKFIPEKSCENGIYRCSNNDLFRSAITKTESFSESPNEIGNPQWK